MMIESQCIEEEAKKASKKMKKLSNYRNKINQFVKTILGLSINEDIHILWTSLFAYFMHQNCSELLSKICFKRNW